MIGTALLVARWLSVILDSLITIVTLPFHLFYWLYSSQESVKCYENIPGIKIRPILTYWEWLIRANRQKSFRAFVIKIMQGLCKVYDKDRICLIWIGFRPMILFFKPETVEPLLNNSRTISKSAEYRFLEPWLGKGILTSDGDKWRSTRKLLTPTFHFQILENFVSIFNAEAAVLTKKLEAEVEKPWIDVVPIITLFTLDTICQTAMGVQLDIQSGCGQDYVERIEQISGSFYHRVFRPWLWSDLIFFYCSPTGWKFRKNVQHVQDFTRKVIKDKKESMLKKRAQSRNEAVTSDKPKRKAFLELLLELHLKDSSFTEENIREEVDTFMLEGHDTTAMAISWTLYSLGRYPKIQDKVFQELEDIFGNDKDREVTPDDLKEMKYLECTIKEALRLYPSVPVIARKLKESVKIGDYTLMPGCSCAIIVNMLHMDPEQFPRPEVFDPDRFLPENFSKRHPYSYIPFSAGPRNCIGQKFALLEQKTVLAHILRKFKVTSLDPPDEVETVIGLIMKNLKPVRIHFQERQT